MKDSTVFRMPYQVWAPLYAVADRTGQEREIIVVSAIEHFLAQPEKIRDQLAAAHRDGMKVLIIRYVADTKRIKVPTDTIAKVGREAERLSVSSLALMGLVLSIFLALPPDEQGVIIPGKIIPPKIVRPIKFRREFGVADANEFWREVLTALSFDVFDAATPLGAIFKLRENESPLVILSELQARAGVEAIEKRWRSWRLYFRPGPILESLREYRARQGVQFGIAQRDLREQMCAQKGWQEPVGSRRGKGTHRVRFPEKSGKTCADCWCIELDLHDLGYKPVTDLEFLASQERAVAEGDVWVDPRRGELFTLVDALLAVDKGAGL